MPAAAPARDWAGRTGFRAFQLIAGCVVLGCGVALLLTPALGADGYSMLVSGTSIFFDIPFVVANLVIGVIFIGGAWARGLVPGLGTLAQVAVVGVTVNVGLALLDQPGELWQRGLMTAVALPVLALGVTLYLGTRLGAGPAEAPALALDPPVPFRVSYGIVQFGGALAGFLMGAAVGVGTLAVIFLLGPLVTGFGRLLRQDLRQPERAPASDPESA